jgi:hypothetical protein
VLSNKPESNYDTVLEPNLGHLGQRVRAEVIAKIGAEIA